MMIIQYQKEKEEICLKLGFTKNYNDAIIALYIDCKSTRRVARIFDVTQIAIRKRLKFLETPRITQGGNHKIPIGKFRFINEIQDICKKCPNLKTIDLYREEKLCICEVNGFPTLNMIRRINEKISR